jgi:N-acetylglucosaminyldiphosphoundecaprenol N-acetyl-beta-D-mannosaminyltransferase
MPKCRVLDIDYDNVTIGQAAADIYKLSCKGSGGYVVTPNAEIAQNCFENDELKTAVKQADYVLPDGAGVVLASKICGSPLVGRAAGYDVSKELLKLLSQGEKRLYLLGAKPGVAQKAANNIKKEYPGIMIAGVHHGYFKADSEVLDEINAAEPDVLFVSLGSPRQELFMQHNRAIINAFMLGIGGSIDVFAGEVKRAPNFFIKLNLEWFYRLLCQPSRIGRMMKLPAYILRAVAWRLRHWKETVQ